MPRGRLSPANGSSTGSVRQIGTPPTASLSCTTPLKEISPANGISNPVRVSTVSTTQARPPRPMA
nr:hypothetical protein [Cryobacterium sp.]